MKYRAEIDGLRAIAIMPVILFHAGIEPFSGGYIGVDIFFVISGFLIASLLIQDIENNKFSFTTFYERRARRLLPALIFTLALIAFLSWAFHVPDKLKNTFQELVSNAFFLSNFHYTLVWDYFEEWKLPPVLLNTWSLAVEEQFYLIIPLILFLFRKNTKLIIVIILVLAVISILWMNLVLEINTKVNYYLLSSRFWELAIGVLLAYFCFYNPKELKIIRNKLPSWLGLLMISALIIFCMYYTELTPYPSNLTLPIIFITALIITIANENNIAGKVLSNSILVYIGKISYPLYLLHFPLIVISKDLLLPLFETWQVNFIAIFLTFIISIFVYHFIENKVRSRKILKSRKAMLFTSALSLMFIASVGYLGHINAIKGRLVLANPELGHVVEKVKLPKGMSLADCGGQTSAKECHLITSNNQNDEKFLIVGDSFAGNLVSPLWVLLKEETNLDLKAKITFACSFIPSISYKYGDECSKARSHLDNLTSDEVNNVIFHINYQAYLEKSKDINGDFDSLTSLFRNLINKGIKVHVIGHRETYNFSPTRAFSYPWLEPFFKNIKNSEILNEYYELWSDHGVFLYLKQNEVSTVEGSYMYYFDRGHLSFKGGSHFLERVGIKHPENLLDNHFNTNLQKKDVY